MGTRRGAAPGSRAGGREGYKGVRQAKRECRAKRGEGKQRLSKKTIEMGARVEWRGREGVVRERVLNG